MNEATQRLLIIDDDPEICNFLGIVAEGLGFEVRMTQDADEFRTLCREFDPSVLVLDLNMPQADGIELLRQLADEQCQARILVISGTDTRVLQAAERLGISRGLQMAGALQKPVPLVDLKAALRAAQKGPSEITAAALREAIEVGQLLVYYQLKIARCDRGTWIIDGAESLVRWNHPEYGILTPDKFIALAEEAQLTQPVTDHVLRETVEQMKLWHDRGLELNVGVNVGVDLLADLGFPDRLSNLLEEFHVDSSRLMLERAETVAMKDPETTMDILTRLRLKGFQLAVDDFGTGYSSLKQLFYMPFSEVKIDKSFVAEIANSSEARTMVNAMIDLAHNLNMTACCEGVESQEILDFLAMADCDKAQGSLISKPVAAAQLEAFVRQWNDRAA